MRAGNDAAARAIFAELVRDQAAPLAQRQRAAELLVSLGGDLQEALTGGASAEWDEADEAGPADAPADGGAE